MFYIIYQFIIQLKPKTYKQEFDRLISGAKKREKLLLKKNFRRKKAFRPHLQDLQVLKKKTDADKTPTWNGKNQLCFQELLVIVRHVRDADEQVKMLSIQHDHIRTND